MRRHHEWKIPLLSVGRVRSTEANRDGTAGRQELTEGCSQPPREVIWSKLPWLCTIYGRCEHGLTNGHQHRETHPPSSPPGKGGYGHRGARLLHPRLYWMAASEPLRLLKKSRTISERESRFASPQASAHSMASRYSAEVMPRQISGYSNAL